MLAISCNRHTKKTGHVQHKQVLMKQSVSLLSFLEHSSWKFFIWLWNLTVVDIKTLPQICLEPSRIKKNFFFRGSNYLVDKLLNRACNMLNTVLGINAGFYLKVLQTNGGGKITNPIFHLPKFHKHQAMNKPQVQDLPVSFVPQ